MAFYRIKEAADKVGVLPHVLRFWESQFPTLKPSKTSRGQRLYAEDDIENFLKLRHLLYTEGYSIAGAKKALKEMRSKSGAGATTSNANEPTPASAAEAAAGKEFLKDFAQELREFRVFVKEF